MTCIFDGCGRPVRVLSAGLCHAHYMQQRRGQTLAPLRPTPKARDGVCSYATCGRAAARGGLCGAHVHQLRRRGSMDRLTPVREQVARVGCEVDDCDRQHMARGLCAMHYEAARRRATGATPRVTRTGCDVEGCDRPHRAKGLCSRHYRRAPRTATEPVSADCSVEGCESPRYARGMCRPHYRASRRVSTPRTPQPPKLTKPRAAKPKSAMPPGWHNPTPAKLPQRPGPRPEPDVLLLDTNPPTDGQIAATRRLLARRGALDLADMLGVA